mgnify:CR=1 FL=1
MKTTTITQAKNGLSALIDLVRAGESITITDRGRPVARLEPVVTADDHAGLRVEALLARAAAPWQTPRQGRVVTGKPLDTLPGR